jgi:hypothetical protein
MANVLIHADRDLRDWPAVTAVVSQNPNVPETLHPLNVPLHHTHTVRFDFIRPQQDTSRLELE